MEKLHKNESISNISNTLNSRLEALRNSVTKTYNEVSYVERETSKLKDRLDFLVSLEEELPKLAALTELVKWIWERANWETNPALKFPGNFVEDTIERIKEISQINDKLFMEISGITRTTNQ